MLWVDGTDIDGDGDETDQRSGDLLSFWKDKSGNDYHLTTSVLTARPSLTGTPITQTNSKLAPNFDGTDLLAYTASIGSTTAFTFYAVGWTGGGGDTLFTTRGSGNEGLAVRSVTDYFSVYMRANNTWPTWPDAADKTSSGSVIDVAGKRPSMVGATAISGSYLLYSFNEVETERTALSNIAPGRGLGVGNLIYANQPFVGTINEVLFYNRALNSSGKACSK